MKREVLLMRLDSTARWLKTAEHDVMSEIVQDAAADIRRLAEALEQISRATAIDNEAALVARRALDGDDK